MKYFQEIKLLPNPEIGHHFLWSKLYQQVHLALVEMQDSDGKVPVGISLPEYEYDTDKKVYQLGSKLRLIASEEAILEKINLKQWLLRLTDYTHYGPVRSIPALKINGYDIFKRKQAKNNASLERLARRKSQRENIPLAQAKAYYETTETSSLKHPYIQIKSLSSDQRFRLFITREHVEQATEARFNCYGLSDGLACVPRF